MILRVILVPFGSIPDPPFTSLSLWPHASQTVAMITTSLKCGISYWFKKLTGHVVKIKVHVDKI